MKTFIKEYRVTNAVMGPDYRLTLVGAQILVQDCFAAMMASHHHAAFDLRTQSLMWIISEYSMRMNGPMPFWGESVDIELWLSESPSVKVIVDYRITHGGREVCAGDCIWAVLDISSRKPVPVSELLSDMECNMQTVFPTHRHKLPAKGEEMFRYTYSTNITDTDFNCHVSNVTYMKLCRNAMPVEYSRAHQMEEIDIRFLHESFIGDRLNCSVYVSDEEDRWLCIITDESGNVCSRAAVRWGDACGVSVPENLKIRNA